MNSLMLISRCRYLSLGLNFLYKKETESDGECVQYNSSLP